MSVGAVQFRAILALPGVAVSPVGAPGTVITAVGVETSLADATLVPVVFTA